MSYADFITLLFAFFVVMFASSQTDKSRAKQVSEAVEKALADGKTLGVPPEVAKILGGTVDDKGQGNALMRGPGGAQKATKEATPENLIELTPSIKTLTRELENEIKAGKVEVNLEPRGLVVSLKQTAFFPSGTDADRSFHLSDSQESRGRRELRVKSLADKKATQIPFPFTPHASAVIGSYRRRAASR